MGLARPPCSGGEPIVAVRPTWIPASIIVNAAASASSGDQRDDRAIVDAGPGRRSRCLPNARRAQNGPRVRARACHRVLGDLHEAEDAAQEAFVTAYGSLWRGDGAVRAPWLTRIAVRIAVRQAGKRRSVTWLGPADAAAAEAVRCHHLGMVAARPDGPGHRSWSAPSMCADMRAAVACLPEPYRGAWSASGSLATCRSKRSLGRLDGHSIVHGQDPSARTAPTSGNGRTGGNA